MSTIDLSGVTKRFPGRRPVLEAVDLTLDRGGSLAVIGPSGSGKSTLLRLIAGLDAPTSGTIRLGGRDASAIRPRDRDAALVFQNQAPFPHKDVSENLAFGALARGVAPAEIARRVGEVADFLGLSDLLRRRPATLSGGEKQRVALGRALVRRPALLLLDEPFSNLDLPLRLELRQKVAEARRSSGMTTILVTHDQDEAMATGDRVAVLLDGRIAQVGPGREVYDRPASVGVARFLGDPPMGLWPAAIEDGGGTRRVRLWDDPDGGGTLDAPRSAPPSGLVTLGLRPEHVRLGPGSPLPFLLLNAEDRGADRLGSIGRGDQRLWVRLPREGSPEVGDVVRVGMDLEHASWFDRSTGLRLV